MNGRRISSLRPLGALDLDRAAALHGESFAPLGERAWTRQDLAELLASPGVAGLLLQADGRDAGFALCRVAADEAELLTIAVRPTDRRRGAGRRLLAAVDRSCARAPGRGRCSLKSARTIRRRGRSTRRRAFGRSAAAPAYYRRGDGPAADALVMRLTLN